jgi:hypothetical protein
MRSSPLEDLERDYRSTFLGYLTRRDEVPLHAAYELGRRAVAADDVTLLDLSRVHHDVFRRTLEGTRAGEAEDLVDAASTFFLEVLATYHMLVEGVGTEDDQESP